MPDIAKPDVLRTRIVRRHAFHPPVEYGQLRLRRPVSKVRLADGGSAWLVTRHEDARLVHSDPRFSSDRRLPGFPMRLRGRPVHDTAPSAIPGLDGAVDAAARCAMTTEFTPRRIEALLPEIQRVVDERLDAIVDGPRPVDLVEALALPVPAFVSCVQLGVPREDWSFLHETAASLAASQRSASERSMATTELRDYLADLVARKENEPGDDLLSRQVIAQSARDGAVDRTALVGLAHLLLIAGYETTADLIALGVLALLENPDQLAAIRADPSKTSQAVDGMLRAFSPLEHMTCRVAIEDVALGGELIRAGDGVIIGGRAADRDAAVFENPGLLAVERGGRRLALDGSPYQCIGQDIAHAELRIVYETLFRRIPGLRLAVPFEELEFKENSGYGLHTLPVTW